MPCQDPFFTDEGPLVLNTTIFNDSHKFLSSIEDADYSAFYDSISEVSINLNDLSLSRINKRQQD